MVGPREPADDREVGAGDLAAFSGFHRSFPTEERLLAGDADDLPTLPVHAFPLAEVPRHESTAFLQTIIDLIQALVQLGHTLSNEAASFAVLQGPDVLYIERVRAGITRLGVDIRIGTTVPSTRTAPDFRCAATVPGACAG